MILPMSDLKPIVFRGNARSIAGIFLSLPGRTPDQLDKIRRGFELQDWKR